MYYVSFLTFNKDKARTKEEAWEYFKQNLKHWDLDNDSRFSHIFWLGNFLSEHEIQPSKKSCINAVDENIYLDYLKPFEIEDEETRFPDILHSSAPISMYMMPWCHFDVEEEKVSPSFIDKKWVFVAHLNRAVPKSALRPSNRRSGIRSHLNL